MRWNVVELSKNGLYVKLYRGFLLVMEGEHELGRVIVDEMNCLIVSAEQATLSKPVIVRLTEHGVPVVMCGKNYHPISITLPYGHHHQMTKVLNAQVHASKPVKKRIWKQLVIRKIEQQQAVLKHCVPASKALNALSRLATKVKSGDPENIEAQAARLYWRELLGNEFRRVQASEQGVNAALNYGYTIMRAACARAVVAAGLLPALGVQHSNMNNAFCLVDDLMEIYRPLVDCIVYSLDVTDDLNPEHKRLLVALLQADIDSLEQITTVNSSMQNLAFSLVKVYYENEPKLALPKLRL